MDSLRVLVLATALLPLVLLTHSATASDSNSAEDNGAPFILVAAWSTVKRMDLNGSNVRTIVTDYRGISAIDYHYRKGMLFYTTEDVSGIYSVPLFGPSGQSNLQVVKERSVVSPVGLAVDWINDKVYWTDQRRRTVEMYDIVTKELSVVIRFDEKQHPQGLSIFPNADFGWFFVMIRDGTIQDDRNAKLMRITTDGYTTDTMRTGLCSAITSIDHMKRKLYWVDECEYNIEESELDGSSPKTVIGALQQEAFRIGFSRGLAQYEEECFYTQGHRVYKNAFDSTATMLYDAGSVRTLYGLKVVHPSLQPPADELVPIGLCEPSCGNGVCIPPGLCACSPGWKGETCSEDVDECEDNNGGCGHICENTEGSYQCSCQQDFYLEDNNRSCSRTSPVTVSPASTTEEVTETTEQATTSPTTQPTTTEQATTPTTEEATTASTAPSTEPPTTQEFRTTAAETTNEEATTTVTPTTEEFKTTTAETTTQEAETTTEALPDITGNIAGVTTTESGGNPLPEVPVDGLNRAPEDTNSSMVLIIISVCVIFFLLIIVAAASYVFVVIFRYHRRRRGSYNVRKNRRQSESFTPLMRNSFRTFADFHPNVYTSVNTNQSLTGSSSVESFERMSIGSSIVAPYRVELTRAEIPSPEPIRFEVTEAEIQPVAAATPEVVHVSSLPSAPCELRNKRQYADGTLYGTEQREMYFSL